MTPQQAANQLRGLVAALANEVNGAEVSALLSGLGLYKQRIFNDGETTDGQSMGGYTETYAKKRATSRSNVNVRQTKGGKNPGRQIPSQKTIATYPVSVLQVQKKDLQFFGNLFKNIQVGTNNNQNVIGFITDLDRLKMLGTEDYIKKDVIALSEAEKKEITDSYIFRLNQILGAQ